MPAVKTRASTPPRAAIFDRRQQRNPPNLIVVSLVYHAYAANLKPNVRAAD